MSNVSQTQSTANPDGKDLTGRRQFARNVAFAWGGYAVNVIAGFIMPRLISDRLGQTTLGIWDFSWSIVSYFSLIQLNLGSSINRYVARYRAAHDEENLCRSVSTIGFFLRLCALLAFLLTLAAVFWVVPLFQSRLGAQTNMTCWVVFFLGLEISICLLFTLYNGVLAGCHRFDIHNSVSAITYLAMAVGMVVALVAGGGLISVAVVHCLCAVGGDVARLFLARRVCPELRIDYRKANWATFFEQARFSAKSLVPRVAEMVSSQSLSFVLTSFFGPAMLAVYFRCQNLVRQGNTLSAKFGFILVPAASSLHAQDDYSSLRRTFRDSIRQIAYLGMPIAVTLAIFGDDVIRLWMGQAYVYPGLIALMAIAGFPAWVQEPIWSILAGMNKHGRIGWVKFIGACFSGLALISALTWLGNDLRIAAAAFLLPQMIVDLAITPVLACRRLGVPITTYYMDALLRPLACVLPYGVCLLGARFAFHDSLQLALSCGIAAIVALVSCYWFFVCPVSVKKIIQKKMNFAARTA
jgi:O-antigen/teichoic acid export membrane protein